MQKALSFDHTKRHLKAESKGKKQCVWISAIITAVLCLIFAGLYLARFSDVVNFQD